MSDKQTNLKCAASGAHLFARYVRTCFENGSEGSDNRSPRDIEELLGYLDGQNSLNAVMLLQQLLCRMFPDPVKECFSSEGNSKGNLANFIWPISQVQNYWRHTHTGPKLDVVSSRPENGCRTIRAKVLRKFPSDTRVYEVEVKGEKVFVIDLFDLKPTPEEFVYFHQRVICEVEEPTDYLRTVGLDGGENQFGRAEPPDSEEIYEQGVRGGKVIMPSGLPTDPLASSGQPGEEPALGNVKYGYLFPIPLPSTQLKVRAEGDSVEVGIPATTLPPTVAEDCECGHECKGGHSCPKAPHYVQFRDPSDKVVSPDRVVGGQIPVDKAVCGTETAKASSQLRLLVEEDYLPSSSPADAGDGSKSGHDRPNPPAKPIEKIVMGGDRPNPYKR